MRSKLLTSALIVLLIVSIIPVLAQEVDLTVNVVFIHIEEVPADTPTTIDASAEACVVLENFTSTEPATVTIIVSKENPHPEAEVPPESPMALGIFLDFDSTVEEFTTEIRVYYTDEEVEAAGIEEEDLRLYYFDGMDWVQCEDTGVETEENYVWANVTHFTVFSPFGALPNQPPIADAGGPYYGKRREPIDFDGTGSYDLDGEIASYAWDFGDGGTGTVPKPSHTYSSTGTFTVKLTVTDDDGLTDSDTTTATISTPPAPSPGGGGFIGPSNEPPVAEAGPDRTVYVDVTIHLSGAGSYDPDGTIEEYHWFPGDGSHKSDIKVIHIYEEAGEYIASLTVVDNNGATGTDSCTVTVLSMPAPANLTFEDIPANSTSYVVDASSWANTTVKVNTTDTVTVTVIKYESNPHPEDPMPDAGIPKYADVFVSDPDAVDWPIYVEMTYTDEEIEGLNESSLGIYYWFNGTWQRCSDTGVDAERNVVWAYMTAEEAAGSPILIGGIISLKPAEFVVSYLKIEPRQIELGGTITISVNVTNIGETPGNYNVTLNIEEDLIISVKGVTLQGGESEIVEFEFVPEAEGNYDIDIEGMIGTIYVVIPIPVPPLPPYLSNLTVTPTEMELGDNVTIGFNIENIDSQSFTYIVTMKIGEIAVLIDVELLAYKTKTVSHTRTPDTVGEYEVTVDGLTGSFNVKAPPPKPAEFEASNLVVTPWEVEPGASVTVSATITNIGEESGGCIIELKLDGTVVDTKTVTLNGGDSETIIFTTSSETEGSHSVEVDGLSGNFTVEAPPPKDNLLFWFAIIIVLVAIALYIIWKRTDWIDQLRASLARARSD